MFAILARRPLKVVPLARVEAGVPSDREGLVHSFAGTAGRGNADDLATWLAARDAQTAAEIRSSGTAVRSELGE